jgi:hypothetical protein
MTLYSDGSSMNERSTGNTTDNPGSFPGSVRAEPSEDPNLWPACFTDWVSPPDDIDYGKV